MVDALMRYAPNAGIRPNQSKLSDQSKLHRLILQRRRRRDSRVGAAYKITHFSALGWANVNISVRQPRTTNTEVGSFSLKNASTFLRGPTKMSFEVHPSVYENNSRGDFRQGTTYRYLYVKPFSRPSVSLSFRIPLFQILG